MSRYRNIPAREVRPNDLIFNPDHADALVTHVYFDVMGFVYIHTPGGESMLAPATPVRILNR